MLVDALYHLVRGIVDHPDDVEVTQRPNRRGQMLKIRVHPEDLGRVIGRSGRTVRALRAVMNALSRSPVRVDVIDGD
jgi:predicted RNA-binding protein YlqC (UPF0109 family)